MTRQGSIDIFDGPSASTGFLVGRETACLGAPEPFVPDRGDDRGPRASVDGLQRLRPDPARG